MMNNDYERCLDKILEKLDDDELFELDWEINKLREFLKQENTLVFDINEEEYEEYIKNLTKAICELKMKLNAQYGITFDEVKDDR